MATRKIRERGGIGFKKPYYRLSLLSGDTLQGILGAIRRKRLPDEEVFDYIEDKGKIPDSLKDEFSAGDPVLQEIGRLPSKREALQSYLGDADQIGKEPEFGDEELQDRLAAYQGLGNTLVTGTRPDIDKLSARINDYIRTNVKDRGVPVKGAGIDRASREAAGQFFEGKYNPQVIAEVISENSGIDSKQFNALKDIARSIGKEFENELPNFQISGNSGQNYDIDIKRIQDILGARTTKRKQEGEIEDFLTKLPAEAEASREEFLRGEEERSFDALTRYAPIIKQNLNAQGLLFSGEVDDALTSRALELGSSLESLRSQLEEEDNQFYYDAAYRNALRKSLESSQDYRASIGEERRKIVTDRENRFRSYQGDIDRKLNEELQKSNYERDLALRRQQLNTRRNTVEDERRLGLVSNIAETGATVVGTRLANKYAIG